jgi:uncharacterized protein
MSSTSVIRGLCVVMVMATAAYAQTAKDTRLANAAMSGDKAAVRALLNQQADVNGAQGDGMTALHWAAFKDDVELAQMLLKAGADVKAATRVGNITPLFMASTNGNALLIDALIKAGANAKAAKTNGTTALMLAAASGSADAVKTLVDAGADANARDHQNGQTALMFAAAENRPAAIKALAARGADLNATSKVISLVGKPRYDDDGNVIKDPPPGQGGRAGRGPLSGMGGLTALHYAARNGHADAVRALVEAGADLNTISASDKTSPMLIAITNGHYDVARFLLDHGANPNLADESGLAPLYAAVDAEWAPLGWAPNPITGQEKTTHLELMKALLAKGADPNARLIKKLWFRSLTHDQHWVTTAGATAFWRAAQSSDVPAMRILVDGGADPNIPSIEGTTPLIAAAGVGWGANFHRNLPDAWVDAVRYCLALGLDPNAKDVNGYTAVHGAAYRGDNEMIKLLVESGARLDVKSKFGFPTDMANGPKVNAHLPIDQPESLALLMKLGAPAPIMPKAGAPKPATPAAAPKKQ